MTGKAAHTARWRAVLAWSVLTLAAGTIAAGEAPGRSEGWQIPEGAEGQRNPVLGDATALARGRRLYQSKCQRCHGLDGTGSGPDADADHAPGDLTDGSRASRNPDGVMFYKIWNGRTKPKMPAMKAEIDPMDVWTVIHYVKTLRHAPVR